MSQYDGNDVYVEPRPASNARTQCVQLLNVASALMNVNGAVTPVNFSFAPTGSDIWYVHSLQVYIEDNGTNPSSLMGNLGVALTNGLLVTCTTLGVVQDICTIKSNLELAMAFNQNPFLPPTTSGFLNATDAYLGSLVFPVPLILSGSTDFIRCRVRDNLTGLDQLRMGATIWRENGKLDFRP